VLTLASKWKLAQVWAILLAFPCLVLLNVALHCPISYRPSPGSGIAETHKEEKTTEYHDDGGNDQHGTPEFRGVQRQQSLNEDSIAAKTKNQGCWYTNPDWWIAGFTGLVFVATTGLWVFTGFMWRTTRQAVLDSALGIDLANKTFNATHRPRIVARGVFMSPPNAGRPHSAEFSFLIANIGDTEAEIIGFKFFLRFDDDKSFDYPIVRSHIIDRGHIPPFKLIVGDEFRWMGSCEMNEVKLTNAKHRAINNETPLSILEFRGTVSFRDLGDNLRHTSFHRLYDFKTERFERIKDSDFEYQG
jgi:hypothetical protein